MPNERNPAIDSRLTEDLVTEPLENVIDPDGFTPRLLALLSNALVWRESHELRRRFGLGTNDWRVISALALRPGSSATEVSEFLGVNKAVVSKSVSVLTTQGLIVLLDGPRGSRPMYLTPSGAAMHNAMMPVSMRGQEIILEGLSQADVDRLHVLLTNMLQKLRDAPATEEDLTEKKLPRGRPARSSAGERSPSPEAPEHPHRRPQNPPAHPEPDRHADPAGDDPSAAGEQRNLLQKLRPPNVLRQYLRGGQR